MRFSHLLTVLGCTAALVEESDTLRTANGIQPSQSIAKSLNPAQHDPGVGHDTKAIGLGLLRRAPSDACACAPAVIASGIYTVTLVTSVDLGTSTYVTTTSGTTLGLITIISGSIVPATPTNIIRATGFANTNTGLAAGQRYEAVTISANFIVYIVITITGQNTPNGANTAGINTSQPAIVSPVSTSPGGSQSVAPIMTSTTSSSASNSLIYSNTTMSTSATMVLSSVSSQGLSTITSTSPSSSPVVSTITQPIDVLAILAAASATAFCSSYLGYQSLPTSLSSTTLIVASSTTTTTTSTQVISLRTSTISTVNSETTTTTSTTTTTRPVQTITQTSSPVTTVTTTSSIFYKRAVSSVNTAPTPSGVIGIQPAELSQACSKFVMSPVASQSTISSTSTNVVRSTSLTTTSTLTLSTVVSLTTTTTTASSTTILVSTSTSTTSTTTTSSTTTVIATSARKYYVAIATDKSPPSEFYDYAYITKDPADPALGNSQYDTDKANAAQFFADQSPGSLLLANLRGIPSLSGIYDGMALACTKSDEATADSQFICILDTRAVTTSMPMQENPTSYYETAIFRIGTDLSLTTYWQNPDGSLQQIYCTINSGQQAGASGRYLTCSTGGGIIEFRLRPVNP